MTTDPATMPLEQALQALFDAFDNIYDLLPCPPLHIEAGTLADYLAEIERLEQQAYEEA